MWLSDLPVLFIVTGLTGHFFYSLLKVREWGQSNKYTHIGLVFPPHVCILFHNWASCQVSPLQTVKSPLPLSPPAPPFPLKSTTFQHKQRPRLSLQNQEQMKTMVKVKDNTSVSFISIGVASFTVSPMGSPPSLRALYEPAEGYTWGPIWLSLTFKKRVVVTADEISGL